MIYNLPRKRAKFEETWLLNESPGWWAFIDLFSTDGLNIASKEIKFISNGTEFAKIEARWD